MGSGTIKVHIDLKGFKFKAFSLVLKPPGLPVSEPTMAPSDAKSTSESGNANVHCAPGCFHKFAADSSWDPVSSIKVVVYVTVPVELAEHAVVGMLDSVISALTKDSKESERLHRLRKNACIVGHEYGQQWRKDRQRKLDF